MKKGMMFRGKEQWPMFRSFLLGMFPWQIDEEEARLLLVAIEQALLLKKEVEEEEIYIPFWKKRISSKGFLNKRLDGTRF